VRNILGCYSILISMMSLIFEPYRILNDYQSNKLFNYVLAASQFCGICAVLTVASWMGGSAEGGFAWSDDPEKQFHYHPTFMGMGMIFLYGEAIIVYRVFRKERKRFTKLLHLVVHSIALVFALVALKAVWDSHDYHIDPSTKSISPIPNLMSLHSWIGISAIVSYFLQFLGGFITFFIPGLTIEVRKFFLPFHQLIGVILFIGVCCTALVGISERAAWKHTCWTKDKEMCGQQVMSNLFGLFIIGYCISILFIVMNPRWKRLPLPEEEALQSLGGDE